jgi:peroxiredoxin
MRKRLRKDDLEIFKSERRMGRYSFNARERNCLFVNAGGKRFVEGGFALGVDVDLEGRGVAVADLDQDGALDLVVRSNARKKLLLWHNEVGARSHFLRVEVQGTKSNRDAIGAIVRLRAGGLSQMRVKMAGNGFQGQSEGTLHFGLGTGERIESLEITWPAGARERFSDLPVDHVVRIVEGAGRFEARRLSGWGKAPPTAASGTFAATSIADGRPFARAPGRAALIHLWASWCKGCGEEVAALNALYDRLASAVELVAITFDEPSVETARAFVRRHRARYPVALGTRASMAPLLERAFGEGGVPIPSTVLLDAEGRVVRTFAGPVATDVLEKEARAVAGRR